mmetsp:Transcript_3448/g.5080  ORF Transcript_3448/g.5080 Transcript_3448/m.5080 type:complete len:119 (-) Transcript_3448:167-523(-)
MKEEEKQLLFKIVQCRKDIINDKLDASVREESKNKFQKYMIDLENMNKEIANQYSLKITSISNLADCNEILRKIESDYKEASSISALLDDQQRNMVCYGINEFDFEEKKQKKKDCTIS